MTNMSHLPPSCLHPVVRTSGGLICIRTFQLLSPSPLFLSSPEALGRPRAPLVALGSWVHLPYFPWEAPVSFSPAHPRPTTQRKGRHPSTSEAVGAAL